MGPVGVRRSRGKLSFTAISQGWLRQAAKRWAADDMPRHRGACPHARVQHIINAVTRLSAHLRVTRGDHGEQPAALGRGDIESFLHRLAYLESAGLISRDQRIRICQDLKRTLDRIRALGLVASAQPAAGLGTDFVLSTGDVPRQLSRPNPTVTCRRRSSASSAPGWPTWNAARADQRSGPGSNC